MNDHSPEGSSNNERRTAAAWDLQRRVNAWFRANHPWLNIGSNLKKLTERGPRMDPRSLDSDPDECWYENDGRRPSSRPLRDDFENISFWEAIAPLFDRLHERHRVAWTYSILMMQPSEDFKGTPTNLGVGDHFTAREEVIYTDGPGSAGRKGWHANQLPPFLVQQSAVFTEPFELISTYAINIRYLTDGLPFTIARDAPVVSGRRDHRRIISVAPLCEVIEKIVPECMSLLDEAAKRHYSRANRWAHGGVKGLRTTFERLDRILRRELDSAGAHRLAQSNEGRLFQIVEEGPAPDAIPGLVDRLARPDGTCLALAKYIVLMIAVWPEWTRITMIPHPVPMLAHPQPGGIVICKDRHSSPLLPDDINEVADLLSICIWPWVALQQSARKTEEATRNAALLGEAIRHDLSGALGPIRPLLSMPRYRKVLATDEECARYLSRLDVLYWSIVGLCGLDDPPDSPERVTLGVMLGDIEKAFSRNPAAAIERHFGGASKAKVPRLYYSVFAELITNAVKRRPSAWPIGLPHIKIAAHQDESEIVINISNAAEPEAAEDARTRLLRILETLADKAKHVGSQGYRKGLGLAANLVTHAGGHLGCHVDLDDQHQTWFTVSLRMSS